MSYHDSGVLLDARRDGERVFWECQLWALKRGRFSGARQPLRWASLEKEKVVCPVCIM